MSMVASAALYVSRGGAQLPLIRLRSGGRTQQGFDEHSLYYSTGHSGVPNTTARRRIQNCPKGAKTNKPRLLRGSVPPLGSRLLCSANEYIANILRVQVKPGPRNTHLLGDADIQDGHLRATTTQQSFKNMGQE